MDLVQYIWPFQTSFKGEQYNHVLPPPRWSHNSNKYIPFIYFINKTTLERLCNNSIGCNGRVGEVLKPGIISALTIKPTKARLCMCLNESEMSQLLLNTLRDFQRVVKQGAFYTSFDGKSGFDRYIHLTTLISVHI